MSPTGKLWGSRVPGWALRLSAKDYHALMAMVAAEVNDRGLEFEFADANVVVQHQGRRVEIPLHPVVDACADAGRAAWAEQVARTVDAALAG